MCAKNLNVTAEWLQLSAEHSQTSPPTYFLEETTKSVYSNKYVSTNGYNYWEWFLIPKELLFKPTSKVTLQKNRLKPYKIKTKPLLFGQLVTIPLRI